MMKHRLLSHIGLIVIAVLTASSGYSQERTPFEIKSSYIFNFIKYIEWPAEAFSADKPEIVIGLLGNDSKANTYLKLINDSAKLINGDKNLKAKISKNRKIITKKVTSLNDFGTCHILLIPSEDVLKKITGKDRSGLQALNEKSKGFPTLYIGDFEGFTDDANGHIEFKVEKKRIRYIFNLAAAKRSNFKVNSSLLKSALPKNKGE